MARARQPWGNGRLLPGGPLREPLTRAGARAPGRRHRGAPATPTPPRSARRPSRAARPACRCSPRCTSPPSASRSSGDALRRRWRRSPAPGCWRSPASRSPAGFRRTLGGGRRHAWPSSRSSRDHHWYTREDLARLDAAGRGGRRRRAASRPRRTGCGCGGCRRCGGRVYVLSVRLHAHLRRGRSGAPPSSGWARDEHRRPAAQLARRHRDGGARRSLAVRAAWPEARVLAAGPWAALLSGQGLADVLADYPRTWRGPPAGGRHGARAFARRAGAILLPTRSRPRWPRGTGARAGAWASRAAAARGC